MWLSANATSPSPTAHGRPPRPCQPRPKSATLSAGSGGWREWRSREGWGDRVRDVMRFTVVDPRGRVSFIAPCATLEALVAACASESQPRTVEQFLQAAEPFVGDL